MALLRNRGRTEPSGGEWAKTGHNSRGKDHSVINYSATLNKQSHVTSQKNRVVGFRLVTDDQQILHGPPRINLLKNHGDVVDDHSQFPQSAAYGSPKKAGKFSPKERLHAAHMKNSPFSREEEEEDEDDEEEDEDDEEEEEEEDEDDDDDDDDEEEEEEEEEEEDDDDDDDDDDSSTDASDDEDDNYYWQGGYGGPYPPKPVRTRPEHDTDYYSSESPKGAGRKPSLVPPTARHQQYTARVSTSSKKDAHRETTRNRPIGRSPPWSKPGTDTQSPKAGRHPSLDSPAGRKPHHTFPVKDSRYETAYNSKPAYDIGKRVTFENPKPKYAQPPQVEVGPQPRKEGHRETINSSEARKRYGGKAVNPPKMEEMEYSGTICCIEAARKYKGVFVP